MLYEEKNLDFAPSPHAVIFKDWNSIIDTLEEHGYTKEKVAKLTGISLRGAARWFKSDNEPPTYYLFSKILYIYCYLKNKEMHILK